MENLTHSFQNYIQELLGVRATPEKWEDEKNLPYYLRDTYGFYRVCILNVDCLLMVTKGGPETTPATIRKHVDALQDRWDGLVIYVSGAIPPHNRRRMLEAQVPFVIPGNQMLVPQLGIALRERMRRNRSARAQARLSPSTQVVVLHALLKDSTITYTPSLLADCLGYTRMTMTRALDEIEEAGIGEVETRGKERILRFAGSRHELWESVERLMRSPVKRRLWVSHSVCERWGLQAGLTALSHYSMLTPPSQPVRAVGPQDWGEMKKSGNATELAAGEPDAFELEIWSYEPRLFAEGGLVDRFSLYLSLRESEDERVEAALEEMMEEAAW